MNGGAVTSDAVGGATDVAEVDLASVSQSPWRRILGSTASGLIVVIVLFVVLGATQNERFLDQQTWTNILRNAVFLIIVGTGSTVVMVGGGLDLSIGSVFAAGAVSAAWAADAGWIVPAVFLFGISVGIVVGLLNGALVNYLDISPIIVTLGTLFAVRSLVVALSGGNPIGPLPDAFTDIGQGEVFGIPLLIIIAAIVAILMDILLEKTKIGWTIRAVGGNREGSRRFGINVRRVSTATYMLGGGLAAFAGVLMASRLSSGSPSFGAGFELQVIAAVVIGGTSIGGSIGTIRGTVMGAILLSVLTTGLILLRVDPTLQNLFVGAVVILAAALDQVRKRRMFRQSVAGVAADDAPPPGGANENR